MPFDDKKYKVIAFRSQNYNLTYKVGEAVVDWAGTATYLNVIMQSNIWRSRMIKLESCGSNQAHSKTNPTKRPVNGLH